MSTRVAVRKNSYKDSVRLLEATRAILGSPGVSWGWALMATPANLETLAEQGIAGDVGGAAANDLVLAVQAEDDDAAAAALETAEAALFAANVQEDDGAVPNATDLAEALAERPDANVAIISVPGPYAALETHKALTAGLNVLLFSDNVPLADEIELKERARDLGRLVMGPGAGTAMIAGAGLGFANRVSTGPVGIVAAAGTGAQEVMSLLDRWGVGVSHVIGVGGRDLSPEVGGLMAESALRALDADERTEAILLVSKPPSREVAERLLKVPSKPTVAALMGLRDSLSTATGGRLATVSLGTPHFSIDEFAQLVPLVAGQRVHADVECYVSTGRAVRDELAARGWLAQLEDAGVRIVVDTCTYITPILRKTPQEGVAMTNSGKWAYYAPGNLGVAVVFGSLRECAQSAIRGKVWRDAELWADV